MNDLTPITLPSGATLKRTRSASGLVTTHIPAEHRDEYSRWVFAKGNEAARRLNRKG